MFNRRSISPSTIGKHRLLLCHDNGSLQYDNHTSYRYYWTSLMHLEVKNGKQLSFSMASKICAGLNHIRILSTQGILLCKNDYDTACNDKDMEFQRGAIYSCELNA